MTWGGTFIAVDWGTSNRRAWRIDSAGQIDAAFADDLGLLSVPKGGFAAAAKTLRDTLGDYPMVMAGMVGANIGWQNAPYVPCPADARALALSAVWVEEGRTVIIPGVCQSGGNADVMRGEEVQALGALASGQVPDNALICHPGTHAKWIRIERGTIASFHTSMTGEIFNLLQKHSILAPQMAGKDTDFAAFQAGLDQIAVGASVLSSLFAIRARHILGAAPMDGASYASGLLIGEDVRAGLAYARADEPIYCIGRADLCDLYAQAIESRGYVCQKLDAEAAFLAGIRAVIRYL